MTSLTVARAAVVMALALLFAPTVAGLIPVWRHDTYSAHGPFVPLFAAVILWMHRAALRAAAGSGHRSGLFVLAVAVALLGIGRLAGSLALQVMALTIATAGIILWIWGPGCLRQAAFPIAYLVLMAPVPRRLVAGVTDWLQHFAAHFAAGAVRLIDVPVYHTGLMLELPTARLEVAEICNGLRFLFALLVMSIPFAHVTQRGLLRKAVLVASVVPIAVLANASRVAIIALGVHHVGPEVASGTVHHLIGKAVWAVTLVPLAGLGLWLARGGAVNIRAVGTGGVRDADEARLA